MATEKQLAANRANAAKSTGPRSTAGKKRAAQNSFQHGLSVRPTDLEFTRQREQLAHQIAGATKSEIELEVARAAAEGDLDLARVRVFKAGLIARVNVTGCLVPPEPFKTKKERIKHFNAKLKAVGRFDEPPADPIPINPADSLPMSELGVYGGSHPSCTPTIGKADEVRASRSFSQGSKHQNLDPPPIARLGVATAPACPRAPRGRGWSRPFWRGLMAVDGRASRLRAPRQIGPPACGSDQTRHDDLRRRVWPARPSPRPTPPGCGKFLTSDKRSSSRTRCRACASRIAPAGHSSAVFDGHTGVA